MSDNITLKYGTYTLTPTPLMSISKSLNSLADGTIIGEDWNITLDGTITTVGDVSGLTRIRQKQDDLLQAFNENGKLLLLTCNNTTLISGYPTINSIDIPEGTWVFQSPYTVSLQLNELPQGSGSGFVSDASEEWNIEFDDSHNEWSWTTASGTDAGTYMLRLSHNLSATGKPRYTTTGVTPAWQNARDFCIPRLGHDNTFITQSGVMNLNANQLGKFDHFRSVNTNEANGTFTVSETWLLRPTGLTGVPVNALEDFTVSVHKGIDSAINTVNIDGTIQGVETRSYGTNPSDFTISTTKYSSAEATWAIVKNRLMARADLILDTVSTTRDINPIPASLQVGHNPNTGSISYSYEYNDRPTNCITNAISETITIIDNDPTDVFASLTVLGRAAGPILQDLNTQTAATRELNIEAIIAPATNCPTNMSALLAERPDADIDAIIDAVETNLTSTYSQVFKTQDQISWSPKEGRISANVAWTYQNCS